MDWKVGTVCHAYKLKDHSNLASQVKYMVHAQHNLISERMTSLILAAKSYTKNQYQCFLIGVKLVVYLDD